MYVRINQVKFPNKMAKEAVQKHAKSTLSNFGVNGRIARLTVNISEISHSVISIWKDKETFKKYGVDEINKFIQMEKEMGAVVSFSEGEASGEISKMFDKSIFEEK
jgi:hypothetical protein